MAKILTFEIPDDEAAQLEQAIDDLISEMRSGREKMQRDQAEIDRLKIETRQVANKTRKILHELEAKWLKAA